MSYEQDMHIDEELLEVELLKQASLMMKHSRMLAEAIRDKDIAKEALELLKAEINLDIRNDPKKYKLEKTITKALKKGEACFYIAADNIELNCEGFEISGNDTGFGIYMEGRKNISILNCPLLLL